MPYRDLTRLITQHRWLVQERAEQKQSRRAIDLSYVDAEIESLFLQIMRYPADEPRIGYAQIEFLVTALAEGDHDSTVRGLLKDAVLAHVGRLAGRSDAGAQGAGRSGDCRRG